MATNHNESNTMTFVFFAALGTLLVVAIVIVMLWVGNLSRTGSEVSIFSFDQGRRVKISAAPAAGEQALQTAAAVDMEAVVAAIDAGGCIACHTIPNIPNAVGQVGPNLANIGVAAASRIEGYSAQDYIRESLLMPAAFTAPECPTGPCPAGVMPPVTLSNDQVELIVAYLSSLGVNQQ